MKLGEEIGGVEFFCQVDCGRAQFAMNGVDSSNGGGEPVEGCGVCRSGLLSLAGKSQMRCEWKCSRRGLEVMRRGSKCPGPERVQNELLAVLSS